MCLSSIAPRMSEMYADISMIVVRRPHCKRTRGPRRAEGPRLPPAEYMPPAQRPLSAPAKAAAVAAPRPRIERPACETCKARRVVAFDDALRSRISANLAAHERCEHALDGRRHAA